MKGDHQVIRHAYENTLTTSARLISYATSKIRKTEGQYVENRQDILAIDDLNMFAINSRRLMDNAASLDQFFSVGINVILDFKLKFLPVTRIINIIIHHKEIKIIRKRYLHSSPDYTEWSMEDWQGVNVKYISPMVMVVSDRDKRIAFELASLIHTFEVDVIQPIVDICSKEKLFLDDFDY